MITADYIGAISGTLDADFAILQAGLLRDVSKDTTSAVDFWKLPVVIPFRTCFPPPITSVLS